MFLSDLQSAGNYEEACRKAKQCEHNCFKRIVGKISKGSAIAK